jgi:hypothetical protein
MTAERNYCGYYRSFTLILHEKMRFVTGLRCDCVTVFEEEGNCIVCLERRTDELMRHLISGELTNYRVVHTSPEPLQIA